MTSTPLGAVKQYIDGFNNGPTAAEDWYRDALAEGEHLGVSDYLITLGEPSHNDVTDDHAYLVVPATFTYNVRGTPTEQTGAYFTVALHQLPEGWRIAAWAWTKGKQ